jgi:hypothetical protein
MVSPNKSKDLGGGQDRFVFGDKLLPLDASQSLGRIFHVQEKKTRFHDLVSGMDGGSFDDLRGEVRARECREWLGEADLSEMAESLGRKARLPGMRIAFLPALGEVEIGRAEVRLLRLRTDVPAAEPIGFGLVEEASDGLRQSA